VPTEQDISILVCIFRATNPVRYSVHTQASESLAATSITKRAPEPSIQGRPEGRLQISMCSGLMSQEWMAMSRSSMSITLGFRAADPGTRSVLNSLKGSEPLPT